MAALAGQIVEPAGNLGRLGPEQTSVLMRHAPATVTYQIGGTPFTDTIPADGTKNVCTLDSASNAIDVTRYAYVTYILPASGGDTQLLCAREADWAAVVASASAVPLDFVHTTGVQRYQLAGSSGLAALEFLIDGGGAAITPGVQGRLVVPFACTLQDAELLADQSGGIVVDIWKSDYAGYPPSSSNSICGSTPPTIAGAQKSQDTTLALWTTGFIAGDILVFNVVSAAAITQCSVALLVQR